MVHTGWKNPGHFKFTPKAGISSEEAAVSGVLAVSDNSENASASPGTEKANGDKAGKEKAKVKEGFRLNQVHDGLSKVRIRGVYVTSRNPFAWYMQARDENCAVQLSHSSVVHA